MQSHLDFALHIERLVYGPHKWKALHANTHLSTAKLDAHCTCHCTSSNQDKCINLH